MKKTIVAVAFIVLVCASCRNPVIEPMNVFVNKTIVPYAEVKIKADSDLPDYQRDAMLIEIAAMRRLIEEAQNLHSNSEVCQ